ncbi:unnamed protein product, partial [Mesorhabditis spiculigera]
MRMCTCQEMDQCVEEAKGQTDQCAEPCFKEFEKLKMLEKPQVLKTCLQSKKRMLVQLIPCFKQHLHAVEDDLLIKAQAFLKMSKSKNVNEVAQAIKSAGFCMKNCIVKEKNPHGFCFERIGCMPRITDAQAKQAIEKGSTQVNWKQEVQTICDCNREAGIGGLQDFCKLMIST